MDEFYWLKIDRLLTDGDDHVHLTKICFKKRFTNVMKILFLTKIPLKLHQHFYNVWQDIMLIKRSFYWKNAFDNFDRTFEKHILNNVLRTFPVSWVYGYWPIYYNNT